MYKKQRQGLFKHIDFLVLDLISLQLAFVISYVFCDRPYLPLNPYGSELYRNFALLVSISAFLISYINSTYKNVLKRGYYLEFVQTIKQTLFTLVLTVFFLFVVKYVERYSRLILGFTFIYYLLISYATRIIYKSYLRKNKTKRQNSSLLIITYKDMAEHILKSIRKNNYQYKIAGLVIVDEDMAGSVIDDCEVVCNSRDAAEYVCRCWVDEVFVYSGDSRSLPSALLDDLLETGVVIHVSFNTFKDTVGRKQFIEKVAGHSVLTTSMNYGNSGEMYVKRAMDIVIGLIGCVITGIIFIIVGPIIYKKSPGPIIIAQERIGQNGKKFKMYKFRTMVMGAEEQKSDLLDQNIMSDNRMFKMDFDPRVIGNEILPDGTKKTGIGQFLRDTSLDEFPQFFNCLIGNMSVVGTRPPLIEEVELYDYYHRSRLSVKPGVTGLWQVSGRSDITDFNDVVQLDQEYINNWNLGLDLKIICKTVVVVFQRKGAK